MIYSAVPEPKAAPSGLKAAATRIRGGSRDEDSAYVVKEVSPYKGDINWFCSSFAEVILNY